MDVQRIRSGATKADAGLQWVLINIAAFVLIGMTLLMVYNVVMRYAFGSPVDGVVDITSQALMIIIVFFSLAIPVHISVRLFFRWVPVGPAKFINSITWATSVFILGLSAYASYVRAVSSYETGERTVGIVRFSIYPYRYVVVVGLIATAYHALVVGRRWVEGMSFEEEITEELASTDVGAGLLIDIEPEDGPEDTGGTK